MMDKDVFPHPRTTMEEELEFLTTRPLKVEQIGKVPPPDGELEGRLWMSIASHGQNENA